MVMTRRRFLATSAGAAFCLSQFRHRAIASAMENVGLRELYKNDFEIGTMVKPETYMRNDAVFRTLLLKNFNAITADNAFKWGEIHPTSAHWNWSYADEFVRFGEQNSLNMHGHVLVWHAQNPLSLFHDDENTLVPKGRLLEKMEEHIGTLVERYKGRIHSWDVVNEAIDRQGWRNNLWYQIMGADYVEKAFRFAHEADPRAVLVYNDYGLSSPDKRQHLVNMLQDLLHKQVPVHAVGIQGHFDLQEPDLIETERTIEAVFELGLRVHFTEMDVDVLPKVSVESLSEYSEELDPWRDGLPAEIEEQLAQRYQDIFRMLLSHSDKVDRATFWGMADAESWKNDHPMPGRTNYPLLFDRQLQPKPAYYAVAGLKQS